MNSYTYEMFRETFEIFAQNSYTDEMFRETFLSCNKSNACEIVVFDWSMPTIVTSFKMGDTRGLPHSQNNVLT